MHPRKLLCPLRWLTVFHVTKSGCSSSLGGGGSGDVCLDRPKLKNELLDEDLLSSPSAALEDAVESEEGVEGAGEAEAGEDA